MEVDGITIPLAIEGLGGAAIEAYVALVKSGKSPDDAMAIVNPPAAPATEAEATAEATTEATPAADAAAPATEPTSTDAPAPAPTTSTRKKGSN